jgi:hypothetical protein
MNFLEKPKVICWFTTRTQTAQQKAFSFYPERVISSLPLISDLRRSFLSLLSIVDHSQFLKLCAFAYAGESEYGNNSVYDFASLITAGEKLPSLAFGFKPFDTTVLEHYPPVPECVKHSIG